MGTATVKTISQKTGGFFTHRKETNIKKTELFELYKEEKREGTIDTVILYIHMPTGEDEVIVNPNVKDKMEYIDRT